MPYQAQPAKGGPGRPGPPSHPQPPQGTHPPHGPPHHGPHNGYGPHGPPRGHSGQQGHTSGLSVPSQGGNVGHGHMGSHGHHPQGRPHSEAPGINGEIRHPPAYPEPPRYPGPPSQRGDGEVTKHPLTKQFSGPHGISSGGMGSGGNSGGGGGGGSGGGPPGDHQRFAPSNMGLSKGPPDDDLGSLSHSELITKIRRLDGEAREIQRAFHTQGNELRQLRETHQRLHDDNQELRDLCCFLDDDRQKGRKLAREWQRFGRYTASVMRQEVTAYQNKLRELDSKQQELIKDNVELKELCLYLDEERNNAACSHCGHPLITRDDGDGSSSSTNADEPSGPPPPPPSQSTSNSQNPSHSNSGTNEHVPLTRTSSRERLLEDTLSRQRSPFNEQVLSYIRSLENRVVLLEAEKQQLQEEVLRMERIHPEGAGDNGDTASSSSSTGLTAPPPPPHKEKQPPNRPPQPPPYSLSHHLRAVGLGLTSRTPLGPGSLESDDELLEGPPPPPPLVSRPPAVSAAMRVLEVQEQLENGSGGQSGISGGSAMQSGNGNGHSGLSHLPHVPVGGINGGQTDDGLLADGEKALLRQMCNVVLRKLEEVPNQHR